MFPSNHLSPPHGSAVGITRAVPRPLYRLLERTNCANVCMKLQEFEGRRLCAVGCGNARIGGGARVGAVV